MREELPDQELHQRAQEAVGSYRTILLPPSSVAACLPSYYTITLGTPVKPTKLENQVDRF